MKTAKQPRLSSGADGPSNQHSCEDASDDADASRVWLPEIAERIASNLSANEVACTLRLVSRATAQQFATRTTVRPAQPVPRWCFPAECRRVCRGLKLAKRKQLVCQTAASGDVANLETAVVETGLPLNVNALDAAAEAGRLAMCQWLVGPGRVAWDEEVALRAATTAAGSGHEDVIDWCLEPRTRVALRRQDCLDDLTLDALSKGQEGLAERMLESWPRPAADLNWECSLWVHTVDGSAAGCSLAGLQRAWERFSGSGAPRDAWADEQRVIASLCSPTADWREKCEFLLAKGCRLRHDACMGVVDSPCVSGSAAVERLSWLQGRGLALQQAILRSAARKGDGVLVAYLLAQGLKPTHDDVLGACRGGCLEALQAMVTARGGSRGPDCSDDVSMWARSGQLSALSWLVGTYGPETVGGFTSRLFRSASASGDVELMAWLLARGCGWNREAWEAAAESGCEAALELLSNRRCPKPIDGEPYMAAVRAGDVRTMVVLRRMGVPFDRRGGQELFVEVIREVWDHTAALAALAWLRDNGCGVDWGTAERAAGERDGYDGRAEVLAWIAEQQAPPPPRRASGRGEASSRYAQGH